MSPWQILRVVLALVLLVAAVLKCHQLATTPATGTGLLDSRWVLMVAVEVELLFGIWLLGNPLPKATHVAAVLCFGAFAAVSLYKGITGAVSCGCFGRVEVSPWYTFTLDLGAVLALLRWGPSHASQTSVLPSRKLALRASLVALAWFSAGLPAAVVMGMYRPAVLSGDGIIQSEDGLVVLEPEKWVGARMPLLPFIEDAPGGRDAGGTPLRDRLARGEWIVVLYREDCPRCREELPRYAELSNRLRQGGSRYRIAAVEVPPYGNGDLVRLLGTNKIVFGRLSDRHEWFVQTPVAVRIHSGGSVEKCVVGLTSNISGSSNGQRAVGMR